MHTHPLSLAHLNLSSTVKFLLEKLQERKREGRDFFRQNVVVVVVVVVVVDVVVVAETKKGGKKAAEKSCPSLRKEGCVCVRACAVNCSFFLGMKVETACSEMTEVRLWLHAIIIIVSVFLLPHATFQ
jgi:hypothetical protein